MDFKNKDEHLGIDHDKDESNVLNNYPSKNNIENHEEQKQSILKFIEKIQKQKSLKTRQRPLIGHALLSIFKINEDIINRTSTLMKET